MEAPISESPIFWDILIQLIEEGQVVPVVGRDVLAVSTVDGPQLLYPYLAVQLAALLGVSCENLPASEELNEVACRYIAEGNRLEDIYPALKTVTSRVESSLAIPEPLLKLAAIDPLRLFVSTTFDSLLARALNRVRFGDDVATRVIAHSPTELQDLPKDVAAWRGVTKSGPPIVYHLMGRVSATPVYAVTQEDYVEFFHSLQSEAHRPARLFDQLNHQSLLLLGCRFSGWLTRFLMRMSKGQRLSAGGRHDYVADSSVSRDDNLVFFLRHFSSATKVYRGAEVVDFIDELHQRWLERHPPDAAVLTNYSGEFHGSHTAEAGAVFLSYAHEDQEAARQLRDALEAAGVDVFFDRADLQSGQDWEERLRRAIRQCSLFVAVISRKTCAPARRFFRVEWNLAVEESQKVSFSADEAFLLPVVIDGTTIDDADVPAKFRTIQWQSLPDGRPSPEFVAHVKQLHRRYHRTRALPA